MHKLTVGEKAAVRLLAERIGDAEMRAQLSRDIETVMVEEQAPDGFRLIFHIDRFERGPYRGQESYRGGDGFTVEGMLMDIDGAAVEVYLYHADGRIFERELLRPPQALAARLGAVPSVLSSRSSCILPTSPL